MALPVGSARRPGLASLPPSFLSSSPATVRSARTDAVKEASAGWVRPAGAAEDTARRALTAQGRGLQSRQGDEVRERRIDRQRPQRWRRRHASAARRHGAPGPKASAERSEGTMEAQMGRDSRSVARCTTRQRAQPLAGDAQTTEVPENKLNKRTWGTDKPTPGQYAAKHPHYSEKTHAYRTAPIPAANLREHPDRR